MRDLNDPDSGVNKRQLLADVVGFVKDSEMGAQEMSLARSLCSVLERSGDTALAGEAYTTFGEILKKSDNRQVAHAAERLIGAGRRMGLVGHPLELKGTTLDGHPFDIKDLKGKVVLVDFWATWCGPCRREFPNIEKNYTEYKDKGFEVVGVSLDQDREALEEYVKEEKVPWITLHEKDKDGDHPAADYYGIIGIPSMMLVGKDGNVVTLSARGEQLGQELEKLLGEGSGKGSEK
jgi:thiol-disulfide isomerase/thioredoxin